MGSLVQLFNEWEIQLLVLLSFLLQVFLFFAGGLRRCTTCKFLRGLIWMVYLGADMVAVYALGLLSRHEDTLTGNHQLAFFWAPFLLIHLGGQDTITAFAIEDINLWLRHLLNLVVQVTLALYIFWKSTNGPNVHQLVVPSILLFVTGTIKYGERTWALWRGSLKSIADSLLRSRQLNRGLGREPSSEAVFLALDSIDGVGLKFYYVIGWLTCLSWVDELLELPVQLLTPKLLGVFEIQLAIMFDLIYTKALVLRTGWGFILRCTSHISFLAAFVLFCVRNKDIRYNHVDTTVTYALFIGGFCLEVCAVFVTMMSPLGWAWLKAWHCSFLASINIGWQRRRALWSNSMGQNNLLNYLGQYDQQTASPWRRQVMALIRKVVNVLCGYDQKVWISKMLDTKFVEVDTNIMNCIVEKVVQFHQSTRSRGSFIREEWPNLGRPLYKLLEYSRIDVTFDIIIYRLHIYTEVYLSRYSSTGVDSEPARVLVRVCRNLSNYMVYLVYTHLEMLQVSKGVADVSEDLLFDKIATLADGDSSRDSILRRATGIKFDGLSMDEISQDWPVDCTGPQVLEEIRDAWIGLLIYAAANSRAELHAAQLPRGGELLTFVWLLMCHLRVDRFELTNISRDDASDIKFFVFHFTPASVLRAAARRRGWGWG